jgi:hypothetical protein
MKITQKIAIAIAALLPVSCISWIILSIFGVFTEVPHYEFQVVNRTPYHLDSIFVSTAEGRNLRLAPNESSDKFAYDHNTNFANLFAEAKVVVYVTQYATTDSTFKNSIGNCIGFDDLTEDEVNRIVITVREPQPDQSTESFLASLEENKSNSIAMKKRQGLFARLREKEK